MDQRAVRDRVNPDHARPSWQAGPDGQSSSIATERQGMHGARDLENHARRLTLDEIPEHDLIVSPHGQQPVVPAERQRANRGKRADRQDNRQRTAPSRVQCPGCELDVRRNHNVQCRGTTQPSHRDAGGCDGDIRLPHGSTAPRRAGIDPAANHVAIRLWQWIFLERHPPIFVRIRKPAHQLALGRTAGQDHLVTIRPPEERFRKNRAPVRPKGRGPIDAWHCGRWCTAARGSA